MSIIYSPSELKKQILGFTFNADKFLSTILPAGWSIKRLVSIKNDIVSETNLMAQTLTNMSRVGLYKTSEIKDTLRKFVIKYGTGLSNSGPSTKLPHGQDILRNRVEGALLYANAEKMESQYPGRRFMWLPSGAKEPRHSHMLRYGKIFKVNDPRLPASDNFPGKAYGCKCGYRWIDEDVSEYDATAEKETSVKRSNRKQSK